MKLLFVCTANLWRSPAAHIFALAYCPTGWQVQSAGVGNGVFGKPPARAVRDGIATQFGLVVPSELQSQRATPELLQWADHIYYMQRSHGIVLQTIDPTCAPKLHNLAQTVAQTKIRDLAFLSKGVEFNHELGVISNAVQRTIRALEAGA